MKKAVAALLALLLLVLFGLPPLVGHMAEEAFRSQAESAPFGEYLSVEVVEYERGLYRSRAILDVGLDSSYVEALRAPEPADSSSLPGRVWAEMDERLGPMRFQVAAELTHGPVGYSRGPFVGLAKGVLTSDMEGEAGGLLELWRGRLDVPFLAEVRYQIKFSGASRTSVVVPDFDYRGDETSVALEGWSAWGEFAPGSQRLESEVRIGVLEIWDPESNLRIECVRARTKGVLLGPRLLLGEGDFELGRMSLLRPLETMSRVDMVGLRVTGATELTDGDAALDSRFTYAVDSLFLGARVLREAELGMATLHIDRDAAERWALLTEGAALFDSDSTSVAGEAVTGELVALVYDFLVAGPVLEVDPARFVYDGEPFRARMRLETDPSALPDREAFGAESVESLDFWTRVFTAEIELEASRSLARTLVAESQEATLRAQLRAQGGSPPDSQVEEMARQQAGLLLQTLVSSGFVTEEGDRYRSRVTYEDGRLMANGRPLALPGTMPGA